MYSCNAPVCVTAAEHEHVNSKPPGLRSLMASVFMRIYLFLAFGRLVLVGASFGGSQITRSNFLDSLLSCCMYSTASALTKFTFIGALLSFKFSSADAIAGPDESTAVTLLAPESAAYEYEKVKLHIL